MTLLRTPRAFNEFFNNVQDMREIQLWFSSLAQTTPTTSADSQTRIITIDTEMNASIGGITIDASANSVTYSFADPGVYKGRTYKIDVKDDTFGAFVYGVLNGTLQTFPLYVEESLIIQDNGSSWRTK